MILYNNTAFIPQSKSATSIEKSDSLFKGGLYYYANQDRNPDYASQAESIFGSNLIPFADQKLRDHAIGNAVISRAGFANNPYGYYSAQGKHIPDNITEAADLYRHIGAEAILEQRKIHDEYEKRRKAKADNQAIYDTIVPRFFKNEINIADIAPDHIEKLNQAGYSLKDLHTARHIVNAYRNAETQKENAAILASDIAFTNGSNIKNVRALVTQALSDDFAKWRQENAGFTWERMRESFRNMLDSTAKLDSLDTPDESGTPKDTLQALYSILGADDTVPSDLLKNRLVFLDAITNGRLQGIESYQEDSFGDAMGDMSTTLIELLPWLTQATSILPASDLYFKELGRGYALQQDTPSHRNITDNAITDKARWTTFANVAVMGDAASRIGKAAGRIIPNASKIAARIGSTWPGAAALTTLGGTINFGAYIPTATGLLNWTYDTIANVPTDLRTGANELASWLEQAKTGRYWLTQASLGAITGAPGIHATRTHWRNMLADRNTFLSRGGTEQQAILTDRLPAPQRIKERQRLINENFAASKEGTLKLAIQNSKAQVNREKAAQMHKDQAIKAALHLDGYELVHREDGNVDLYYEGEAATDGSFNRGAKKMTLSPVEADTFIQAYMAPRLEAISKSLRSRSATESLVDAFVKSAKDPIDISYFRGTDTIEKVKSRAEKAQEIIDSRVKQLTEEGISESEARAKAAQEKHNSVSRDLTLQDAITTWQSMERRIKQEKARSSHLKDNNNLGSRAYVITRAQQQDSPAAIRRILRLSEDASPREMAEEYAEEWLSSYLAENNYTTADAYRFLNDLQSAMGGDIPKLLSTPELDPSLHSQLINADDNYSPEQAQALRRDVREAFSLLMLSDLMQKAMDGHADIPDWAAPFFSGADLPLAEMQRELAIGAAIKQARTEGWGDEARQKLLNAPAKAVSDALTARTSIPDASTYIRDYYTSLHRQAELDARYGEGVATDPTAIDSFLAECDEGQQHYDDLHQHALQQEAEPHQQLVNEAIHDPENADKSPEQIIQTLADNSTTAKVQEIENSPASQQDSTFVGGKCVEVQDNGGLICKNGIIHIAKLKLLPNFKLGADSESGVKNPLPGNYYPDHDPIKVMHTKAGELIVFSGRHRLAKAKEAGVENINCYLYPESDNYSLAWAKKYDIELNIRDNQATPLETALYIRGEFTDGNPPDPATLAFINRKGSNGAKGWEIGTKAIPEVIDALRNNRLDSDDIAVTIAKFAPNNPIVQMEGLKHALLQESKTTILTAMEVALEMEKMKADLGLENQVDLWGQPIRDERFDNFVTKYLIKKRQQLSEDTSLLNNVAGKKGAAERREKHGISVQDEAAAKQDLAAARDLRNRWKSPFQYADLRNEIYTAFRKAHPDAAEIPYFNAEADIPDASPINEDSLTGNLFDDSFTASQAESSPLFKDGAAETANAIITKPGADFSLAALHASPHLFYKFSTDFMGSGEGTQAFGWGLYFATNTSINKSYYNLFKRNSVYTPLLFDGKVADNKEIIAALSSQLELLDKKHGTNDAKYETTKILDEDYYLSAGWGKAIENEESYIASYEERLSRNYFGYSEHGLKLKRLRLDIIKLLSEHDIKRGEETHSATNYRVELNVDDSNLLLWDKPVSDELFKVVDAETQNSLSMAGLKTSKGKSIYETLAGYFESKEEASEWLAAHGYKGIKFLDRASREKGEGTYNYVIFSGDDIKITAVNKSGVWSMDEGWEPYTDPTANFSLSALHTADTAEADAAVDALGDLYPQTGRFHQQVQAYYPTRGEKLIDERIERTIRMLVRRQQEIQAIISDTEESQADGLKLAYEGLALIRSLNNSLPNTRRFSLEPYENYFSMYAKLHGSGDAQDAAALANSEAWQDIMMRSFENRIVEIAETSTLPDDDFWQLAYDQMPGLSNKIAALQRAFGRISADVNDQYAKRINAALEAGNERKLETLRREIRNLIWAQLEAEHADKLDAAFRGFGLMRASRLLDKFLTRAAKQIDLYHKDIILGRITRAMNAINPRKASDQNPQRGKISPQNWRKAQDYYRLLLMTEAEKTAFEETHYTENEGEQSWESMTPDTLIQVPTYDQTGKPITITCTRQEYDVYASFRAMSTAQADAAAQSLGTFVKHGKEAWNIAIQQHKDRVRKIADDFISRYGENWSQSNKRVSKERNTIITQRRKLLNLLGSFLNEGQFLRVLESPDLFGKTATEWSHAAARANEYIESRETVTDTYVTNAISNILGLDTAATDHNTKEKNRAAIRDFIEKINKIKKTEITLTPQLPDFRKQQLSILREQLLRRINFETRKKNYSPSKLAAAVTYIRNHPERFTPEIAQEIYQKYGRLGNLEAYIQRQKNLGQTPEGAYASAFSELFTGEKYKHLTDIVTSAKHRAEDLHKKYIDQHGEIKLDQDGNPVLDKNGNTIKEWKSTPTKLEISPSQAAYHVLICEQPTYADAMARLGYTPETVQQLRDYADKAGAMQLGYQLREAMNERVDTIANIYESIFGLPFPREEKYFRAFFQPRVSEKNDFEAQQLGYGSAGTQAITILYTRNHRTAPIAPGMGLMEAFFAGMKMQDVLIGYADPANGTTLPMMLRSLMSSSSGNQNMHTALQNALGETGYKQLRQHVDDMNAIAPAVDSAASKLNLFVRRLGSAGSLGFLNFRISSLAKQGMADFNSLLGTDTVTIKEWMLARARYIAGNTKISLQEMMQQDFIKSRYKGYDYTAQHEAYTAGPDVIVTQGTTSPHTIAGMTAMEKYDAYHTARSSVFLYDAVYRKLQKQHPEMSHQDKHDAAMAECRLALTRKGQPQNFRQRSLEQRKASFMSLGNFFLGGESINTAASILSMLARGNKGDLAKSALTWVLQGAGIQALNAFYHFITDDEETRRRRNIGGYLWGTLLGPLAGLPLVSNLVAMATGAAREALPREYRPYMPYIHATSTIPGADLERTARDIHKAFTKNNASGYDKAIAINAAIRDLCILGLTLSSSPRTGGAATVNAYTKAATGISNAIDFLLRTLRAADERL